MDEKSTQEKKDERKVVTPFKGIDPSLESLNFIKMFAHSYHAEPSLPVAISATCLN